MKKSKPDPTVVGERIKRIRESMQLSMDEFASRIDSNAKSGTVNNWESGKNLPNKKRLKKIADLGSMSLNELLYGDPKMYMYDIIINGVKEEGELFNTLKSYLEKVNPAMIDQDHMLSNIVDLINNNIENIYMYIKFKIMRMSINSVKKDTLYDNENFIIESVIEMFSPKRESSFHNYYAKYNIALEEIPKNIQAGSSYTIEQLTEQYRNKGYNADEAFKKSIDHYFLREISKSSFALKDELDLLYSQYIQKINEID